MQISLINLNKLMRLFLFVSIVYNKLMGYNYIKLNGNNYCLAAKINNGQRVLRV